MENDLTDAQKAVMEEVPAFRRGTFLRAYTGKSRNAAIKAFCLRCVGYLSKDVQNCTAFKCPLHQYRPYQKGDDEGDPGAI